MILSKIKLYAGIATGVLMGFLGLWGRYQSNRADNAEEKAESLSDDIKQAEILNDLHEESKRIDEGVANETEDDLRAPSADSRT